jgi:hypothetical protein
MFKTIKKCPICGSKKSLKNIANTKNVYSIFLSKILKKNEEFIINKMINVECATCGLIYKKNWLKKNHAKKIYTELQPKHPGGLNTLKENFGKKKFLSLTSSYLKNLKKTNEINKKEYNERLIREITKILLSTSNKDKKFLALKKLFIESLNCSDMICIRKNYCELSKMIDKPKIYSQFWGFGSPDTWGHLISSIKKNKIQSYAEIGCPFWGMFKYIKNTNVKKFFLNYKNSNFWGDLCTYKDLPCYQSLEKNVKTVNLLENNFRFNFIGVYNYLDHVENPLYFLRMLLKKSRYLGIISEDYSLSKKIDCQHFSSWQKETFLYVAKKLSLSYVSAPYRIGKTNYLFYLLDRENQKS